MSNFSNLRKSSKLSEYYSKQNCKMRLQMLLKSDFHQCVCSSVSVSLQDLHNPSPTPLVPISVCSLPGVHSGAYRSDVDPSITIFTMKVQRKEKMGLEWYHWVNRWASMSVNYDGGGVGVKGSVVVMASAPLWLQHVDRGKQTSSGFNLNVKWAAGDEAGPWGRMSRDEIEREEHRGTLTLTPGCFKHDTTLSGNQPLYFTAANAWLKFTKDQSADWTFLSLPLWQGLKHQLTWEK